MAENLASTTDTAAFALHLRAHAAQYFPDFGQAQVSVRLVGRRRRPYSLLYRYELATHQQRQFVLVKTSLPQLPRAAADRPAGQPPEDRPRLVPANDPALRALAEHTALIHIHAHFSRLGDRRFGTIRILDSLPEQNTIIMQEARDPNLRQWLAQISRLRLLVGARQACDLQAAFRNAGAWLRIFHGLPAPEAVQTYNAERADFILSLEQYAGFLAGRLGDPAFFRQLASSTVQAARQALPEHLPLGLRHGDYRPPNLLAASNGRITVLDTAAMWRAPIYEDLAYFLVDLKANWAQVFTQGQVYRPSQIEPLEQAFLAGYFGQVPVPWRVIRLYEMQALLDRWAGKVFALRPSSAGSYPPAGAVQLALMRPFFRRMVTALSQAVDRAVS